MGAVVTPPPRPGSRSERHPGFANQKLRPLPYACPPVSLPRLFLPPPVLGVQESTSALGRGVGRAALGSVLRGRSWLGVPPVPLPERRGP